MTNTESPATAGPVCGRCSTGFGKDRIQVRHASVAEVRACFTTGSAPIAEIETTCPPAPPAPVTEAGLYRTTSDGALRFYRVRIGKKSGHPFAELLVKTGSKYRFEYAKGAIKTLTADDRVSAAEAAEFGLASGWCCACATQLTHPASLKVGYGPTCAANNGWPHSYADVADEVLAAV